MFYFRLLAAAFRSLDSHFLRSLLATVGVLIGVASVVASMAILEGAQSSIMENMESFGSNVLFVIPNTARVAGQMVGTAQTLSLSDVAALREGLEGMVDEVAPRAQGSSTVKFFDKSDEFPVVATSDAFFRLHGYKAVAGEVFDRAQSNDDLSSAAILGHEVATKLFGGMDPIGEKIKIGSAGYTVVGVMEERGQVGTVSGDQSVFLPIRAGLRKFFNRTWLTGIEARVIDTEKFDEVEEQVTEILRREHNLIAGEENDFRLFNQQQHLKTIGEFTLIFQVVLYSIAGISLVVGGIGIMNIMLVSVTERTREIGVRMAVGARRTDIMVQFLVESLIISVVGGLLGLLLGAMMVDLLDQILQNLIATAITYKVVVAALVVSTVVGVVSGLYPAYSASRKNPVEALRYE